MSSLIRQGLVALLSFINLSDEENEEEANIDPVLVDYLDGILSGLTEDESDLEDIDDAEIVDILETIESYLPETSKIEMYGALFV